MNDDAWCPVTYVEGIPTICRITSPFNLPENCESGMLRRYFRLTPYAEAESDDLAVGEPIAQLQQNSQFAGTENTEEIDSTVDFPQTHNRGDDENEDDDMLEEPADVTMPAPFRKAAAVRATEILKQLRPKPNESALEIMRKFDATFGACVGTAYYDSHAYSAHGTDDDSVLWLTDSTVYARQRIRCMTNVPLVDPASRVARNMFPPIPGLLSDIACNKPADTQHLKLKSTQIRIRGVIHCITATSVLKFEYRVPSKWEDSAKNGLDDVKVRIHTKQETSFCFCQPRSRHDAVVTIDSEDVSANENLYIYRTIYPSNACSLSKLKQDLREMLSEMVDLWHQHFHVDVRDPAVLLDPANYQRLQSLPFMTPIALQLRNEISEPLTKFALHFAFLLHRISHIDVEVVRTYEMVLPKILDAAWSASHSPSVEVDGVTVMRMFAAAPLWKHQPQAHQLATTALKNFMFQYATLTPRLRNYAPRSNSDVTSITMDISRYMKLKLQLLLAAIRTLSPPTVKPEDCWVVSKQNPLPILCRFSHAEWMRLEVPPQLGSSSELNGLVFNPWNEKLRCTRVAVSGKQTMRAVIAYPRESQLLYGCSASPFLDASQHEVVEDAVAKVAARLFSLLQPYLNFVRGMHAFENNTVLLKVTFGHCHLADERPNSRATFDSKLSHDQLVALRAKISPGAKRLCHWSVAVIISLQNGSQVKVAASSASPDVLEILTISADPVVVNILRPTRNFDIQLCVHTISRSPVRISNSRRTPLLSQLELEVVHQVVDKVRATTEHQVEHEVANINLWARKAAPAKPPAIVQVVATDSETFVQEDAAYSSHQFTINFDQSTQYNFSTAFDAPTVSKQCTANIQQLGLGEKLEIASELRTFDIETSLWRLFHWTEQIDPFAQQALKFFSLVGNYIFERKAREISAARYLGSDVDALMLCGDAAFVVQWRSESHDEVRWRFARPFAVADFEFVPKLELTVESLLRQERWRGSFPLKSSYSMLISFGIASAKHSHVCQPTNGLIETAPDAFRFSPEDISPGLLEVLVSRLMAQLNVPSSKQECVVFTYAAHNVGARSRTFCQIRVPLGESSASAPLLRSLQLAAANATHIVYSGALVAALPMQSSASAGQCDSPIPVDMCIRAFVASSCTDVVEFDGFVEALSFATQSDSSCEGIEWPSLWMKATTENPGFQLLRVELSEEDIFTDESSSIRLRVKNSGGKVLFSVPRSALFPLAELRVPNGHPTLEWQCGDGVRMEEILRRVLGFADTGKAPNPLENKRPFPVQLLSSVSISDLLGLSKIRSNVAKELQGQARMALAGMGIFEATHIVPFPQCFEPTTSESIGDFTLVRMKAEQAGIPSAIAERLFPPESAPTRLPHFIHESLVPVGGNEFGVTIALPWGIQAVGAKELSGSSVYSPRGVAVAVFPVTQRSINTVALIEVCKDSVEMLHDPAVSEGRKLLLMKTNNQFPSIAPLCPYFPLKRPLLNHEGAVVGWAEASSKCGCVWHWAPQFSRQPPFHAPLFYRNTFVGFAPAECTKSAVHKMMSSGETSHLPLACVQWLRRAFWRL